MLASLILVAMIVLAGFSHETGVIGAIALIGTAVLWFRLNGSMEGTVVVTVSLEHGLTGADLAGIAAVGLALWRGYTALRRPGRTAPTVGVPERDDLVAQPAASLPFGHGESSIPTR